MKYTAIIKKGKDIINMIVFSHNKSSAYNYTVSRLLKRFPDITKDDIGESVVILEILEYTPDEYKSIEFHCSNVLTKTEYELFCYCYTEPLEGLNVNLLKYHDEIIGVSNSLLSPRMTLNTLKSVAMKLNREMICENPEYFGDQNNIMLYTNHVISILHSVSDNHFDLIVDHYSFKKDLMYA